MSVKKTLTDKLSEIQSTLNAPKNQRNNFGKYNYRSCEDILEGLKPLIKALSVSVTLSDSIEMIGHRIYIKSTAKISDGSDFIESTAYARETETQKGMSEPQLTGSASSYARKYALNGLFAIDDVADHDSLDNSNNVPQNSRNISMEQLHQVSELIQNTKTDISKFCSAYKIKTLAELKSIDFGKAINQLYTKLNGSK